MEIIMSQDQNNLIWLDMEMSGLQPDTDRILELAVVITDAELNLVRVGDGVNLVETNDPVEVVNTGKFAIDRIRLDHVPKPEIAFTAAKVLRKRRRAHVEFKLAVRARKVAAQHVAVRRIE